MNEVPDDATAAPGSAMHEPEVTAVVVPEVIEFPVVNRKPKPRLWSALVVGIAVLPLAIIVSTAVFLLVMAARIDWATARDPVAMEAWLKEFTASRVGLLVLALPGQLVFLSVACGAAWLSPVGFRERLQLCRGMMPLWTWGIFALATPAIGALTSLVMSLFFTDLGAQLEMLENVFRGHRGPFVIVVLALVAVLPGLSEELLFRGYLQSRLLQRLSPWAAITISTVLFSLAHLDPRHVLAVVPLGLWMGIVAWRSGSVLPAVVCHMANNTFSIIMTHYSEPSGFAIDPNLPTLVILAISGSALLISFNRLWAKRVDDVLVTGQS